MSQNLGELGPESFRVPHLFLDVGAFTLAAQVCVSPKHLYQVLNTELGLNVSLNILGSQADNLRLLLGVETFRDFKISVRVQ